VRAITSFCLKICAVAGLALLAGCASHQAGLEQHNMVEAAIASADKHGGFMDPAPSVVKAKHETRIEIEEAQNATASNENIQAIKTSIETEETASAAIVSLDEPAAGEAVRLTEEMVDDLQVIESRWAKLAPEEKRKILNILRGSENK
jgi:hypothetical protein